MANTCCAFLEKTKSSVIFLLFTLPFAMFSQPLAWKWARSIDEPTGGSGTSFGKAITLNPYNAASYATGEFHGTIDCNPGPGVFNLTSTGINDAVIYSLDSTGLFQWAKHLVGSSDSEITAYDVIHDPGGFIYITGGFHGTIDFDPGIAVMNISSQGWGNACMTLQPHSELLLWENIILRL